MCSKFGVPIVCAEFVRFKRHKAFIARRDTRQTEDSVTSPEMLSRGKTVVVGIEYHSALYLPVETVRH